MLMYCLIFSQNMPLSDGFPFNHVLKPYNMWHWGNYKKVSSEQRINWHQMTFFYPDESLINGKDSDNGSEECSGLNGVLFTYSKARSNEEFVCFVFYTVVAILKIIHWQTGCRITH